MKICIDAGHGGTDSGAVGPSKRYEKTDALKMALALQKELQARGHTVIMTRTTDSYPSLSARYTQANNAKANVYVSLHRNSAGPSAHGVEVLYRTITDKTAANNAKSKILAQDIDKRIVDACGFRDRGAKIQNTNTAVLHHTTMPAVTVEAGFVSNVPTTGDESDNERFDRTFDKLIAAIADGIEHAMTGKISPSPSASTAATTTTQKTPTAATSIPAFFQNGGVLKDKGAPYKYDPNAFWGQGRLRDHNVDVKVDGLYGPGSAAGTKLFQAARIAEGRDCGCPVGPDGVQIPDGKIGRKTAAILAE